MKPIHLFCVLLLLCYSIIDIGSIGSKKLPFLLMFLLGILHQMFLNQVQGPHKRTAMSSCCIRQMLCLLLVYSQQDQSTEKQRIWD